MPTDLCRRESLGVLGDLGYKPPTFARNLFIFTWLVLQKPLKNIGKLWKLFQANFSLRLGMQEVGKQTVHIHGPTEMPGTGVIGFVLTRNAEVWLETFLEHHFRLGVTHIVLMDNGSTDNTVELASRTPNITILTCNLAFRDYQHAMRRWMQRQYGHGRWSLMLDIDELFDYPGSQEIGLDGLTDYLDANGFDAVFATMLDLYPASLPVSGVRLDLEKIKYFETASIVTSRYKMLGITADPTIVHEANGGLRSRVFGLKEIQLVKHPLRKDHGQIWYPLDSHFIYGVKLADFSAVLRHYKYVPGFEEHVDDSVEKQQYWRGSHEYRHYQKHLKKSERIALKHETSRVFVSANELLQQGYLRASDRFRDFLKSSGSISGHAGNMASTENSRR